MEKSLKLIQSLIGLGTRRGEWLVIHPYSWDPMSKVIVMTTPRRLKFWYLNIAALFSHYGFILIRSLQVLLDDEASVALKLYMQFAGTYFATASMFQLVFLRRAQEIPKFIRTYVEYYKTFQKKYLKSRDRPSKYIRYCELLFLVANYGFGSNAAALILYALFRPESKELVSSVFEDPYKPLVRIGSSLVHGYYAQAHMLNAAFVIQMAFGYWYFTLDILHELGGGLTLGMKAKSKSMLAIYNQLLILLKEAVHTLSFLLVCSKLILLVVAVLSISGSLGSRGIVAASGGVIGSTCLFIIALLMDTMGELHGKSSKFLRLLAIKVSKDKVARRELRSLPALKFKMGSLYYLDKALVLTVFKIIFDSIINALILSK